jgi:(p)ppGpp synthase/HD superfamily hydrolase
MIFEAIRFAAEAHTGQYRKGTKVPYIVHPLGVVRTLIDAGCGEPVVVAGVLHDVVEDTSHTLEELRGRFGPRVAELVAACTEPNHFFDTWERRKRHTVEMLADTEDHDVLMVAIADKLDNIQDLRDDLALRGEIAWRRFNRGREKQRWYYESLEEIFTRRLTDDHGRRLAALFAREVESVFGARVP